MTKDIKKKLTLDRPATYQIKVPGTIDVSQADWTSTLEITVESEGDGPPVTTLTGEFDQAALYADGYSFVYKASMGDLDLCRLAGGDRTLKCASQWILRDLQSMKRRCGAGILGQGECPGISSKYRYAAP